MSEQEKGRVVRVDIVSDVVCPWCVVGYRQLARAAEQAGVALDVNWHPFELNPRMADEGEGLREHLARKYGTTVEQSRRAREALTRMGAEVGFRFDYKDDMRIVPTFRAHQLLRWAGEHGKRHALKQALFSAYFTEGRDVSDADTLATIAGEVGLDAAEARAVVTDGRYADAVRAEQRVWLERGVSGVPTMVFDGRDVMVGARGIQGYGMLLDHLMAAGG